FEEKVHRQLMIEKLSKGMAILNDEEKALIEMLYFDGMSERQITEVTGIARTTLNYRRNRILKKLSDFFEN
ncbi:RNA polymerase sigma factor, partial [uncultured Ruminococcus sp.]|uniref:RNA polymerase sigma factor n=1 Tax=uncultured Ruminococcus sp. TaxID=165186 RepID=UPI0025F92BEF